MAGPIPYETHSKRLVPQLADPPRTDDRSRRSHHARRQQAQLPYQQGAQLTQPGGAVSQAQRPGHSTGNRQFRMVVSGGRTHTEQGSAVAPIYQTRSQQQQQQTHGRSIDILSGPTRAIMDPVLRHLSPGMAEHLASVVLMRPAMAWPIRRVMEHPFLRHRGATYENVAGILTNAMSVAELNQVAAMLDDHQARHQNGRNIALCTLTSTPKGIAGAILNLLGLMPDATCQR